MDAINNNYEGENFMMDEQTSKIQHSNKIISWRHL